MKWCGTQLLGLLLGVLLLGGCADTAGDTTIAEQGPVIELGPATSAPDAAKAGGPVDAESLLASTLQQAAAGKKRAIVHFGATW